MMSVPNKDTSPATGTRNMIAGKRPVVRQSSFRPQPHHTVMHDASTKMNIAEKASNTRVSLQKGKKDPTGPKKEQPVFNTQATSKFDSMLRGDLADLPPLPKTRVKIFLSSTFSDMRAERNSLSHKVYPPLLDYCAARGYDFQVCDMRWGITDDSINDHSVEELCLLEVENCQKTSIGPNFVVLSGDRYGFRPIPVQLDVNAFEVLRQEANKLEVEKRSLLDEWYKLDENSVPNTYVLQPIRSKFTFFGDFSPGCEEPRQKDTADWWKTFAALQEIIRTAADEAYKDKKISSEERHLYFQSVTESEIHEGIMKASEVDSHCLVYKRELRHLHDIGLNDNVAQRYIDVTKSETGNVLDNEVETLKQFMFENQIKKKLVPTNIKTYSIDWIPSGVNPITNHQHEQYLTQFCSDFIVDCKMLIEKAEEDKKSLIKFSDYYSDYDSTVHHLKFTLNKCETFCGREGILEVAKAYVLDKSGRKPLILHAESGGGKTSIMAMIMKNIPKWISNKTHVRLIRYLGTTPQSHNVYDVLADILRHLSDVYDMIMPPLSYKTMKRLVEFAPRYLRQIANKAKEPVIILLDSLDQLNPTNNAYSMYWLPIMLPQNVKLIVSTLPEEHGILTNLKKRLPDPECYVQVPVLTEQTANLIVEAYLKLHRRSLTANQMIYLLSVFNKAPSPLYLKLLIDEAKHWKSYSPMGNLELASTVKDAISKLFQNLENKFGHLLVSHALGYITIGLTGLTEFEIDDVLSCDDAVLNEVYKYHDPPVPGIVHIPPVLWARIWYDIREYLVERMSYGKNTQSWYHRQFMLTAVERYTESEQVAILHQNLTAMYLQEVGIKRTITLANRGNLEIVDADRMVTPQPFTANNKRKVACLPYHALRAYKLLGRDRVKANIYCNFKYVCARIAAFSVSAVINDLKEFVEESHDEEVQLLLNFLSVSIHDLTDQLRLAVCLLAYINPAESHIHLKEMLCEVQEFLEAKNKPIMIPTFPCLAPRQCQTSTHETSLQGVSDILAVSNCSLLLQKPNDIEGSTDDTECETQSDLTVWCSETRELTSIKVHAQREPVGQYVLSDECVYYVTRTALVVIHYGKDQSDSHLFVDLIPNLDATTESVQNIFANSENTAIALTWERSIILVTLDEFKASETLYIHRRDVAIEHVFVMNSCAKTIAVGKVKNYQSPTNQQQDPENRSFICVFEQGKDVPVQFLEFGTHLDSVNAVLADHGEYFVIATKGSSVYDNETRNEHKKQSDSIQLLIFEISHNDSSSKDIEIPSSITKIYVHPERQKVLVLCVSGSVYYVSSKAMVLEVKLNVPANDFAVMWEQDIGLFCSDGGKIAIYDLKSDKILIAFTAHPTSITNMCLLDQQLATLGANNEMKVWSINNLLQDASAETEDVNTSDIKDTLLEQLHVVAVSPSYSGTELITCHDDGMVKIWYMHSQTFLRQYDIGISASIIHTFSGSMVAFHDTVLGKMKLIDIETGKETMQLPETIPTILHSVVNTEKDSLFLTSAPKKGKEQIDIINIRLQKVSKTIRLQSGLLYEKLESILSANGRYLVFRQRMSKREFARVKEIYHNRYPWKKGGFSEQQHRYRFTAVALSEGSGALVPCQREQSKIPTIGIFVQSYRGHVMLISRRRWVVFWDIPTGRCDRQPSKLQKVSMFFRPAWLGPECTGANQIFMQSADQKFLACGSDDGYMFVYNSETGLPVGSRKPSSKHNAEVQCLAVSPNSKWIASSCRNNVLKLWESSTGTDLFSVLLDAEVKCMSFTPDSQKLVLYTGTFATRVLIFSVAGGGQKTIVSGR